MIEGTQSSLSDLLMFEFEHQPGVPLNDVQEVSNYVAALNHADHTGNVIMNFSTKSGSPVTGRLGSIFLPMLLFIRQQRPLKRLSN
jgi:hypothetical protein